MRAYRVVSDPKGFSELLYRPALAPQLGDNLTACCIEEPGVEMHLPGGWIPVEGIKGRLIVQ